MKTKTKKRTDAHRPSTLIPLDYEFMGFSPMYKVARDASGRVIRDHHDEIVFMYNDDEQLITDEQSEYLYANQFDGNAKNKGGCDCCGNYPNAVAYYKHIPTGEVITVGRTCSDKISENAFDKAQRKSIALIAKHKREATKVEGNSFIDSHSGLRSVLESGKHEIFNDMLEKAHKYGSLSEKQIAFAFRLYAQCIEREEEKAKVLAKLDGSTLDCTQRITVTGTVKTIKWDSEWEISKMLVELDSGFKVWGTMPGAFESLNDKADNIIRKIRQYGDTWDAERQELMQAEFEKLELETLREGDKVQFTAKFEMSKDDATFAFFKRPTKLTVTKSE